MITLRAAEDNEQIKKLFRQNGLEAGKDSGCVRAMEKETMLGYSLYELNENTMTVLAVFPAEDKLLADGILRSTIHIGLQRGATEFTYSKTAPEELLEALGFIENPEKRLLCAKKLFESCGCHEKNSCKK